MATHSLTQMEEGTSDNSEEVRLQEVGISTAEASAIAKADLNFLASLAMPGIFEHYWPSLFLACWNNFLVPCLYKVRDFSKLALCLPRGFGKSTFIKLLVLYAILFTKKKFILILAETATKAEAIISDIIDMLDEQNIKAVFGDWRVGVEKDTASVKKFGYRGRNIIIAGLGAGGSVRGLNLKNERPDMMIFDDVQSREDADSEIVSKGLMRWMIGTAMKAKSPKGCMFLFVANMYPTPHSMMRKLLKNSQWTKFKTGGIVMKKDGGYESIWEALQPLQQLLEEFKADEESGHPEIFQAEVLNDENASVNTYVDFEKLLEYPFENDEVHQGNFIIIDPATDKANADAVSIGYFEVFEGKPVCRELDCGSFSPAENIRRALKLGLKHNCFTVFVEGVAYQSTLKFWANFLCAQMGIQGFQWVEIYPGKSSKNSRILTMFKQLTAQEQYLHPDVRNEVFAQIRGFNALRTDNVDGILDLLTYAPKVITDFWQYLQSATVIESQEYDSLEEFTIESNSSF